MSAGPLLEERLERRFDSPELNNELSPALCPMSMESLPARTAVTSVPLAEAVTKFLPWLELGRRTRLTTIAAYTGELSRFQAFRACSGRGFMEVTSRLSGASPREVAEFFPFGMLANVTTVLGLPELCAALWEAKHATVNSAADG
jgi:hypothetical protein